MGRAKAWLPLGDELMLSRVVRQLAAAVSPVVVVAAPGQEVPPLQTDVLVVRDEVEGRGPLQGLVTGLAALQGRADAAFVAACDLPFLQPAFVRRLIELLGDHAICVPRIENRDHPLAAVYRLSVLETAQQILGEEQRGVHRLFDRVPTRIVERPEILAAETIMLSLRNVNTPEDYDAARRDLGTS